MVDPGIGAASVVERALARLELEPVAVLLTHGHLDHAADAHLLGGRFRIPTLCHPADHAMVTQPSLGLGPAFADALAAWGIDEVPQPPGLRGFEPTEQIAGLQVTCTHSPGHTPGSVVLRVEDQGEAVVLTGDVVFAGSIGRTDLPGGSMAEMLQSLRRIVDEVPEDLALLPGHGRSTTLAAELHSNPYLSRDFLEG